MYLTLPRISESQQQRGGLRHNYLSPDFDCTGRELLQAPVPSDQAATVARNALTRLVSFQSLATAQAAATPATPNATAAAPAGAS